MTKPVDQPPARKFPAPFILHPFDKLRTSLLNSSFPLLPPAWTLAQPNSIRHKIRRLDRKFPRAIDLILDAIIGYSLSGSPRGAEGRGAPETKWSLLFPASYNNQSTCAIIIEARYDHSPDSFSKEAHT